MTLDEALHRLHAITDGIDETETDSDAGWWETSVGAEFGYKRREELEALIRELVEP